MVFLVNLTAWSLASSVSVMKKTCDLFKNRVWFSISSKASYSIQWYNLSSFMNRWIRICLLTLDNSNIISKNTQIPDKRIYQHYSRYKPLVSFSKIVLQRQTHIQPLYDFPDFLPLNWKKMIKNHINAANFLFSMYHLSQRTHLFL